MKRYPTFIPAVTLAIYGLIGSQARAEFHTFTNSNGEVIRAELISHKQGKITIKREDGRQFELDPGIFSDVDQLVIQEWMAKTPAKVSYDFEIKGSKKLVSQGKHATWAYVISTTNKSTDTVSKLTFSYRLVFKNSWTDSRLDFRDGSQTLTEDLETDKTFILTTAPIKLPKHNKQEDDVVGCLLKISDMQGNVIEEWVSGGPAMKGITWDTKPPEDKTPKPGTGVIR